MEEKSKRFRKENNKQEMREKGMREKEMREKGMREKGMKLNADNKVIKKILSILLLLLSYNLYGTNELEDGAVVSGDVAEGGAERGDGIFGYKYNILEDKKEGRVDARSRKQKELESRVKKGGLKSLRKADKKKLLEMLRLKVRADDIIWSYGGGGQYIDLYVRKKVGIGSVMLTNMYYGEEFVNKYGSGVYGLRTRIRNGANDNEKRYIGGKLVSNKSKGYKFLIDSTVESHKILGQAFKLRIPNVVEYGYKSRSSNYGVIRISKGVTLNLRSYKKKYGNGEGGYYNNPIRLKHTKEEYVNSLRSKLKKVGSHREGAYNVLVISYKSKSSYLGYFLLKDRREEGEYRKVSFLKPEELASGKEGDRDEKAYVKRAITKSDGEIEITSHIYLKERKKEHEYEIVAIDENKLRSKNYLSVLLLPKEENVREEVYEEEVRLKGVESKVTNAEERKLLIINESSVDGSIDAGEESKGVGRGEGIYFKER